MLDLQQMTRLCTYSLMSPQHGVVLWVLLTPLKCRLCLVHLVRPLPRPFSRLDSLTLIYDCADASGRNADDQSVHPDPTPSSKLSRFAGSGPDIGRLGHEMRSAWTSFAWSGVPAICADSSTAPETMWLPWSIAERLTMVFATDGSALVPDPLGDQREAMVEAKTYGT